MSHKYLNKYRSETARATWWNYAGKGAYFITICTRNREHYFGEIISGIMQFTEIGQIAHNEWLKTTAIRPDMHIELDEFVVMPNHVHGIIIIGRDDHCRDAHCRDAMHGVPTINGVPAINGARTTDGPPTPNNQFGPQSKNLASIIRGYKSAVTTHARKNNIVFAWQDRFHDHIIRNQPEYNRISSYINQNPLKWVDDRFYS